MTFSRRELRELAASSRRHVLEDDATPMPANIRPLHPQLRDLLIAPSEDKVAYVSGRTLYGLAKGSKPTRLLELPFLPACLTTGCGLIAAGGQNTELAIRPINLPLKSAADVPTGWGRANYSIGRSINNSIHLCPQPGLAMAGSREGQARLYASNNDASISIWDCDPPLASTSSLQWDPLGDDSYDAKFDIVLRKRKVLSMQTAINHSSVSPNGKLLVAVGDDNAVNFFSVPQVDNEDYQLLYTTFASEEASFSTDWSRDSQRCAVASQDGTVTVFDVRCLSRSTSSSSRRTDVVATFRSSAGSNTFVNPHSSTATRAAIRTVKFSPGHTTELLAFSEQSKHVHVVDARTYDPATVQILDVPSSRSTISSTSALASISPHDATSDLLRITNRDWSSPSVFSRLASAQNWRPGTGVAERLAHVGLAARRRDQPITRTTSASSVGSELYADCAPPTLPRRSPNEALVMAAPASGFAPAAYHQLSDYFQSPLPGFSATASKSPVVKGWNPWGPERPERIPPVGLGPTSLAASGFEDYLAEIGHRAGSGGVELCGMCWSPSGDTLFASTEFSTFAYPVDTLSRSSFPIATIL